MFITLCRCTIYTELGCSSNADKMMFLLNERTREL